MLSGRVLGTFYKMARIGRYIFIWLDIYNKPPSAIYCIQGTVEPPLFISHTNCHALLLRISTLYWCMILACYIKNAVKVLTLIYCVEFFFLLSIVMQKANHY